MKVTELRRHAPRAKDVDALSPEGEELARRVAPTLPGGYTHYVSSPAERATQTLAIFAEAHGETPSGWPGFQTAGGLQSPAEVRWRTAGKAAGSSHLDAIRAQDPDLVQREITRLADVVAEIAAGLPDGARALVVGHSPLIEAAVAGLTGEVVAPLAECEGVALWFEDDRVTRLEQFRL